jgi:hypothetical protein
MKISAHISYKGTMPETISMANRGIKSSKLCSRTSFKLHKKRNTEGYKGNSCGYITIV